MKHLKHLFILIIITLFALAISPVDKAVQAVSKESASTDSEVSFLINNKTNALERANDDTDVFGYTRSGPVTNSWIDAGSGTDTGIDCDTVKSTGAIPIGFTFDYYEFSYSELYISCYGYISFNNTNLERTQPRSIPSIETPNAVIAPLWTMAESINYVHYTRPWAAVPIANSSSNGTISQRIQGSTITPLKSSCTKTGISPFNMMP